jgi:hypothetical protein
VKIWSLLLCLLLLVLLARSKQTDILTVCMLVVCTLEVGNKQNAKQRTQKYTKFLKNAIIFLQKASLYSDAASM